MRMICRSSKTTVLFPNGEKGKGATDGSETVTRLECEFNQV